MSNNVNELSIESLGDNKHEIIVKAMQSTSPEQLLTIAEEYDLDIDISQAAAIFAKMHQESMELSDDELDMVAGGKSSDDPFDRKIDTRCIYCNSKDTKAFTHTQDYSYYRCGKCNKTFYF